MKKFSLLVVLVLSTFMFLGTSLVSYADQSARGVVSDSMITTSVKEKLATELRSGTLTGVEVNTTKGEVTLAGKAHSEAEKKQMEQVARSIDGVTKVN
ncbi:MAG: BON domain-containing protein, partial [Acidobacteriota bacterium]